MTTPLSPAAQAGYDAFHEAAGGEYVDGAWVTFTNRMIAAALRAAVAILLPDSDLEPHAPEVGAHALARREERQRQAHNFLSIANELDPQP